MEDEQPEDDERPGIFDDLDDVVLVEGFDVDCTAVYRRKDDGGMVRFPVVIWRLTGESMEGSEETVRIMVPVDRWPEFEQSAVRAMNERGVSPKHAQLASSDDDGDDDGDDDEVDVHLTEADRELDAKWWQLAGALAAVVEILESGEFLILVAPGNRFVQVVVEDAGARLETVSNQYLPPEYQLDFEVLDALEEEGWSRPTHFSPGDPVPETGSPNHFRDLAEDWDPQEVAALMVDTLRLVHDVGSPDELRYKAGSVEGTSILLPSLGLGRVQD